jgi:hypothetical protein
MKRRALRGKSRGFARTSLAALYLKWYGFPGKMRPEGYSTRMSLDGPVVVMEVHGFHRL